MNDRTWVGRALRVMLVVVMVLPFIGYFAPAASAHHPEIVGSASCDAEGLHLSVTSTSWTLESSRYGNHDDVRVQMSTDGGTTWHEIGNGQYLPDPSSYRSFTLNFGHGDSVGTLGTLGSLAGTTVRVRAQVTPVPDHNGGWYNDSLDYNDGAGTGNSNAAATRPIDIPMDCRANLTVEKVVDTAGAPDAVFPFTMTDEAEFDLADAGSKSHTYVLDPAESTLDVLAAEGALPANWSFVLANCKDPTGAPVGTVDGKSASVTLSDGDDITCTFHNKYTPPEPGSASLTVVKVVDTADAPAAFFPFTMTDEAEFDLADAGSKSHTYVLDPAESTLGVLAAEGALPANWSFVAASCADPSGAPVGTVDGKSASVTLSDGDDITCTFHNKYTPPRTPSGTIVIRKITQGSVGTFGFDLVEHYEGDVSNAFDLTTVTQGVAVDKVFAGMSVLSWYSVSEDSQLPARWALTSASCVSDIEGQPVPEEFGLSDGETVTCTFVNTYTPPPPPPEVGSIGDFVWSDDNLNGVQDSGEPGISKVTVNLYNGIGVLLASTATDATGHYLFSNLGFGTYVVEFVKPAGLAFTTANEAGPDPTDSDANVATGRTGPIALGAGVNDMSWDAGIVPQVSPTTVVNTTTTAPPETLPFTGPTSTGVGGFGAALVLLGGLVLLAFRKKDDPVVESGFARRLDS